jgi:hypothetical protein
MISSSACLATWNGASVSITAQLVPRYAWNTASIDVAVDGHTILRTGGVLKSAGTHAEGFTRGGTAHAAELTWGIGALRSFPFSLRIDGAPVVESRVPIQNWWLALWPWAAFACFLAWRYVA